MDKTPPKRCNLKTVAREQAEKRRGGHGTNLITCDLALE
jgi:hypothetical protein